MPLSPAQQFLQDFSHRAQSETWTQHDPLLDKLQAVLEKLTPTSQDAIVLAFSLAKIYGDLGEIDKSFALLSKYNQYHKVGKTDTIEDARSTVAAVRSLFERQSVTPLQQQTARQCIFIIGMPRSGTSLVEQILASHRLVQGGGELKYLGQWCNHFIRQYSREPDNMMLDKAMPELFQHYQQGIAQSGGEPFITDKMPVNFLWLGFIFAAFTDARIVHVRRDLMATCWSNFKTPFAGSSNAWACDLADIGEFYTLYRQLMSFWAERFEHNIYHFDYEQLTRQQEEQTRQLLDYCGLPWDPACLDFHNNPRTLHTASRAQIKRPMYQGSSQAWRAYEHYLQPLIDSLG